MDIVIKGIINNISELIKNDEGLSGVKEVIEGFKSSGRVDTPSIFITFNIIDIEEVSYDFEIYNMDVVIVCCDKSSDPSESMFSTIGIASKVKRLIQSNYESFSDEVKGIRCSKIIANYSESSGLGSLNQASVILKFRIQNEEGF